MTLDSCAALVERGDPDRFLATMAAPVSARELLFPLYAFNLEVARVPLLASEPGVALIRLGWWREALTTMGQGGLLPDHPVLLDLALALPRGRGLEEALADLVVAREHDIAQEPFVEAADLMGYLDRTAGTLLWVAAAALGAEAADEAAVRALGRAQGLANWLLAVPALMVQGRVPLPLRADAVRLARDALAQMPKLRRPLARNPALLATWRSRALLHEALHYPHRITAPGLGRSELARRLGLLVQVLRASSGRG